LAAQGGVLRPSARSDYLTKPFSLDELLARVRNQLAGFEQGHQGRRDHAARGAGWKPHRPWPAARSPRLEFLVLKELMEHAGQALVQGTAAGVGVGLRLRTPAPTSWAWGGQASCGSEDLGSPDHGPSAAKGGTGLPSAEGPAGERAWLTPWLARCVTRLGLERGLCWRCGPAEPRRDRWSWPSWDTVPFPPDTRTASRCCTRCGCGPPTRCGGGSGIVIITTFAEDSAWTCCNNNREVRARRPSIPLLAAMFVAIRPGTAQPGASPPTGSASSSGRRTAGCSRPSAGSLQDASHHPAHPDHDRAHPRRTFLRPRPPAPRRPPSCATIQTVLGEITRLRRLSERLLVIAAGR